jgi:hypothetical protein
MLHLRDLRAILATACTLFDITIDELAHPQPADRLTPVCCAIAWALHQHAPACPWTTIADLLGCSAADVAVAVQQAEARARVDVDYAFQLAALRGGCHG